MNCSGTVRLNPLGAIFITVVLILIVYFNFGDKNESVFTYKTVSLKALLVASIEIAKRGGAQVKAIRELVTFICFLLNSYLYFVHHFLVMDHRMISCLLFQAP